MNDVLIPCELMTSHCVLLQEKTSTEGLTGHCHNLQTSVMSKSVLQGVL